MNCIKQRSLLFIFIPDAVEEESTNACKTNVASAGTNTRLRCDEFESLYEFFV